MTDPIQRHHKLGFSYVMPAASSEAFALGARVHEVWSKCLADIEAIVGKGKVEITDIVVRRTGPKGRVADKVDTAPLTPPAAMDAAILERAIGRATAPTPVPEPVPEPHVPEEAPAPLHEAAHGKPKRAAA